MNYYDELGVRRDAPVQEIRQAYRVLVRLLHPDTQGEDDLRMAAERQLNRLNAIVAVLSNPELRRAYDLQLNMDASRGLISGPPKPAFELAHWEDSANRLAMGVQSLIRLAFQHWSVILIGAVTCGATLASFLLHNPSETVPESRGTETVRTAPEVVPKVRPANQLPRRQTAIAAQNSMAAPAERVAPQVENPNVRIHPTAAAKPAAEALHPMRVPLVAGNQPLMTAAVPQSVLRTAPPAAPEESAPSFSFTGNWFYAVDLDTSKESNGYRAVYVELLLSESGEIVSGNYRARYAIPDKAISPEMSFHLEGKVGPDRTAKVRWSAPNGAKGEADLNLEASGVMVFHWWSTEIREKSGLSSGSARLVRQRVP